MLYVKVDAAGNPVEAAKNYRQIREEYLSKGSIFPAESVLNLDPASLGYAFVPESEPLPPKAGSKIVPDVPTKNSDGTMTRTWKYEPSENEALMEYDMRIRRDNLLRKYADTLSPIRWEDFTEEQKQEVRNWRKSLLDLPTAEGWPYVMMPQTPSFLIRN